jgi:hypothetical protein
VGSRQAAPFAGRAGERVTESLHSVVTAIVDGAGDQEGRAGKVRAAPGEVQGAATG